MWRTMMVSYAALSLGWQRAANAALAANVGQRCETTRWTKNDISKCKSGESRRRPLSIPAPDYEKAPAAARSKAKAE
jgi:hypothetical protein